MRNQSLIVASITALLAWGAIAPAQQQDQSVPDAPQPQKKPAAKPPSSSSPSPPAKDDNAFPEDASRAAAKAANDSDSAKHPTTDDNPFPESESRAAAKAAGNDQDPPAAPKLDLPPGVSSSQSGGSLGDADEEPGAPKQATDPVRAAKDTQVGDFYLKQGDFRGALLRYQDAAASDSTNVEAIFGLAETQRQLKKNADAARNYQLYLEIVPNGPRAKQALKALKTLQAGK